MSRILSALIQAASQQETQRTCHLLSFVAGATQYRFAEDSVTHLGSVYQPGLRLTGPVRYSERLQPEPVEVQLQNITLSTAALLKAEGAALQGQEATLERLFLAAGEALLLFRGRISEIALSDTAATLQLAGELDPTATQIPRRQYSALCAWDFQDSNCGYVPSVDPPDPQTSLPFTFCPKDLFSCQARGRQHRFPGFLHLTRELTESVEGAAPVLPDDRALSVLLGD